MVRLTLRLSFSGMRRRKAQSALSVIVVVVSTAALTVAVSVSSVAEGPFDRTFEATNGAHVTAASFPGGPSLNRLSELPGVVASTGVRGVVFSGVDLAGKRYGLRLVEARATPELEVVSRPVLLAGSWPRDGEVLLERSFARFQDLRPGSTLTTRRARLVVSGIAAVAAGEPYPRSQPGLAFATRATLLRVAPRVEDWGQVVGLRVANPRAATSLATTARGAVDGPIGIETWTEARAASTETLRTVTVILSIFGALLLLAAGAVLATLVGGRVVTQGREIGVLKATGFTPGQVARLLMTEQLTLAAAGVVIGLGAGYILTPVFVSTSAALLNAPESPNLNPLSSLAIGFGVLALVGVFSGLPGWRTARKTAAETVSGRHSLGSATLLGGLADRAGAPIPVSVGARGSFARRGRVLLTALSLALTVASVVATLGMEASLEVASNPGVAPLVQGGETPQFDPVDDDAGESEQLRPIVYSLDAVLLFVGLTNLVATLLLTTRERVRDLGMLKAVGLTPRQVSGALVSEQVIVALVAGFVGIPLGLALFRAGIALSGSEGEFAYPSWWSLALLVPAVVVLVALVAAPLARKAASLPVSDALRFE